jgi:hypothetical protein
MDFVKGGARENRPPRGSLRKDCLDNSYRERIVTEREAYQTENIPFIGSYG